MADKYDNNGSYNSGDFKRNAKQDGSSNGPGQDGEVKINEKAGEYVRELLAEKIKLNSGKFPLSSGLIDTEVAKVQATGRWQDKDGKYVDMFREKPSKVTVKVLVPIKEHPKFNFVGQLLGPKGSTMKQLQEETMCKMAVLGRGSMRDRQKEEELRNSLDPKYAHLSDELHVEISAVAPPAEAYARVALGLAEVKKYLIPNAGQEMMWQPPMERGGRLAGPPPGRMGGGRGPPRMPAPPPRAPPTKGKALSILDRARSVMDAPYGYEDSYGPPEPPMRPPRAPEPDFYYDHAPDRFFEDDPMPYYKDESREYKTASAREVGTRRPAHSAPPPRHAPYSRPQNSRGRPANKSSSGGGGWA